MTTLYAPGLSGPGTKSRALAWLGKRFSPGWCLFWCLTEVFKVPGLGDFDHDGDADATDYWKAAKKRGKVVETSDPKKIPAGVLIMWTGGSHGYGHAAYSLGDGHMVSTDLPTRGRVGKVAIDEARKSWGLKLVGYVLVDGNGFHLTRATPTSVRVVKLPEPVRYLVTANGGLIGRAGPSTTSAKKWLAKKGSTVEAVSTVSVDGVEWVVNKNGTHYAAQYLTKKA